MTPETSRLPWIREGRDRRLQKNDLDLLLCDLAQGDRDQYLYLFGKALKGEILRRWPDEKDITKRLVAPKDRLFERCWDYVTGRQLWSSKLTTTKFCQIAVENFIQEAANAVRAK